MVKESTSATGDLEEELLRANQNYLDKMELGNKISNIMDKGVVREQSLTKEHKEALSLYRKTRARYDITNIFFIYSGKWLQTKDVKITKTKNYKGYKTGR